MVTGFNATILERHLSGNGIIFLRNENYETTQMFDSVKIGLEYLKDKCEKVLFTPVDVPLFTARTVQSLLASGADLACPVCEGQQGHPILLSSHLLPEILNDCGEQGLKGAMDRCSAPLTRIEVDDPGTIHDADTPEDFSALVEYHNSQLVRPVVSVSLNKEKAFFDEKIAMLLMLIDETKSVRAAGKRMQVFETLGVRLLDGEILLLDEIGGIELTNPVFAQALGLSEEYILAADRLRRQLSQSEDTLLYCLGDKGVNVLSEGSFHAETVNLMSRNLAVLPSRRSAVSGHSVAGDIAVPRLCGI